ncbi:MAG: lamin tail domain-containing protein, partial [Chloroflexi bacterium]|nr:lamin tail domain-containing protein [Chloroflexota bacterium]
TIYGPPAPTATPALPQVRVAAKCSQFDAPGDDNQNLNEEYVCFENYGDTAVDMTGWQVADEAGKRYTFPAFVLAPKAIVRLRTGSGINTQTDLYWESARAIWNNAGDTVYLYDGSGNLVNRYRYDRALLARPS